MNNHPEDHLQTAFNAARSAVRGIPGEDVKARARERFLLEASTVSLNSDMRHRTQTGALSDLSTIQSGERRMNRLHSRRARLIAAVLLGALLAGGFWAMPSLRTLAQEIINFFMRVETDTQTISVLVNNDPVPSDEVYVDPYNLTLDEIVALASFDVRLPTYVPRIMGFKGALVSEGSQRVELRYGCKWDLLIVQTKAAEPAPPFEVGVSAVIEDVPIRDTVGQYVRGMWRYEIASDVRSNLGDGFEEVPATRVWSNDLQWHRLAWREDGINFSIMTASGSLSIDHPSSCQLTKDDYVAIVEGLRPASEIER